VKASAEPSGVPASNRRRVKFDRTTKFCPGCSQSLPHESFTKNKATASGLSAYCRSCTAAQAYQRLTVDEYGLTWDEYSEVLRHQGGVCAICGQRNQIGRRLYVDHDHQTNQVRGLLCHLCNTALGHLRDDPAIARHAADYLERSPSEIRLVRLLVEAKRDRKAHLRALREGLQEEIQSHAA
jgi:hypothetical protein